MSDDDHDLDCTAHLGGWVIVGFIVGFIVWWLACYGAAHLVGAV